MDLNEKEERLRFLLSKIDAEAIKFKQIKENLEKKKKELMETTSKIGVDNAVVTLYSEDQENILDFVNSHLLELENLKNYLNNELQKVIKQKELLNVLKQKYGDKVSVEETQFGTFKIKYNDEDINNAKQLTNLSKKLISSLKENTLKKTQSE